MNTPRLASKLLVALFAFVNILYAQDKLSKDDWQTQMGTYKQKVTDLQAQLKTLTSDKEALKSQADKLDENVRSCEDALYAMLGVSRQDDEAFEKELSEMEARVVELQRMSEAELLNHRDELERMSTRLGELTKSKVAIVPRYMARLESLQDKVAGLVKSLSKEQSYTVGTWTRNGDCLWNIARKKDIYDNPWMWPKIWQGNRDKIKDPDRIQPRWVLRIPEGRELSKSERSAANSYYRKRASDPSSE